jgi:hypothetical protein
MSLQPIDLHETSERSVGAPVEYWYSNALLDAPASPVDGWALVGIFFRNAGFDEGKAVLIPPDDSGAPIDFGTGPLPPGSLSVENSSLRIGSNSLRGSHPHWSLHLVGQSEGRRYTADIDNHAGMPLDQLQSVGGQLDHLTCLRTQPTGTVQIGDETWKVGGVGFYERVRGSFGWQDHGAGAVPLVGWDWYSAPSAGPDGVAVSIWHYLAEGREFSPRISLTADGETFHQFGGGRREVLQTGTFDGLSYASQIRITDRDADNEIDLVVTRRDTDARSIVEPAPGVRMLFITGFADITGHARLDGRTYDLSGRAFGSIFERSNSQ